MKSLEATKLAMSALANYTTDNNGNCIQCGGAIEAHHGIGDKT